MRKWEDIVKDKIEEPEGELPESVFAEFRARRDAAAAAPAPKRFPLVWAAVPAVAAGLVAVFLFQRPVEPDGDIQIIRQPSATVAVVTDSTITSEPGQTTPLIAQSVTPKAVKPSVVKPKGEITIDNTDPAKAGVSAGTEDESVSSPITAATETEPKEETEVKESGIIASSPFLPEKKSTRKISMKVVPATGVIAGGSLIAAAAAPLLGAGAKEDANPTYQSDPPHGGIVLYPDPQEDERTGEAIHYFPLKLGLSARFPISERLSITTGLDYSWYKSSFTYSLSGEKTQNAHYLGIPVRFDWTLASGKWLDVYLGGGLEGDWCVGATLEGNSISKDGFSASLQGAGGIQFKPTKRLGLYLEPQLGWYFTPKGSVLETCRTENPLMFSVAAGLRFTIGQ